MTPTRRRNMNPLTQMIARGTFGEVFVQLKLLQFDVQSAPPIKDSGNDLIAIRGETIRAIQVKSSASYPHQLQAEKAASSLPLDGLGEARRCQNARSCPF